MARLALAFHTPSGRNPYLDLLEAQLAARGVPVVPEPPFGLRWLWQARREVAVLHFHWRPDVYYVWRPPRRLRLERFQGLLSWFTLSRFAARILAARALGYRVAWTIHEVDPPETGTRSPGSVSRKVDLLAAKLLARSSHVLLAHDRATAEEARARLGDRTGRVEIVPHGSFVGVYPPGHGRDVVRTELHIPDGAFVFLSFGSLRPDKEIELLLRAFRAVPSEDVVLVIAGRPTDSAVAWSVVRAFRADRRIRPLLGTVPSRRVAELFGAADAAVSSRSQPRTSGSLILALSLGLPVVAARLASHEELLAGKQAGWLYHAGDPDSLRAALEQAAGDPADARVRGEAARQLAQELPGWDEIAEQTASRVLGQP